MDPRAARWDRSTLAEPDLASKGHPLILSNSEIPSDMITVAFAYLLTGEENYAGFKERFLTVASWEVGG